jgi:hypothetical protein
MWYEKRSTRRQIGETSSSGVYVDVGRLEKRKANPHREEFMCGVTLIRLLYAPTIQVNAVNLIETHNSGVREGSYEAALCCMHVTAGPCMPLIG